MCLVMPVLFAKTVVVLSTNSEIKLHWLVLIVSWICYVTWARNSEPLIILQYVKWNNDIAFQGLLEASLSHSLYMCLCVLHMYVCMFIGVWMHLCVLVHVHTCMCVNM